MPTDLKLVYMMEKPSRFAVLRAWWPLSEFLVVEPLMAEGGLLGIAWDAWVSVADMFMKLGSDVLFEAVAHPVAKQVLLSHRKSVRPSPRTRTM